MMKISYYEIESIQIGKVFKVVVFNIYQKKTLKLNRFKKRIYWLNGTKEDK